MGKKIVLAFSIITFIALGTIIIYNSENKKADFDNTKDQVTNDNSNSNVVYTISGINDYLYTDPGDLYKVSDVVVIGYYVKDIKTYASSIGEPNTISEFRIKEIVKGNTNNSTIDVRYLGGKITLSDYIATQSVEQLSKNGLDKIDKSLAEKQYVEYVDLEAPIELVKSISDSGDNEYMLFLKYDEKNNVYVACADGYSILKVNDKGYLYSYTSKEYKAVDFYSRKR